MKREFTFFIGNGEMLRINAALGIEGALLHPDDPDMTLKEFNQNHEGTKSAEEELKLELERIEKDYPDSYNTLASLPRRLYSGKGEVGSIPKGLFCAYRLPATIIPEKDLFQQDSEEVKIVKNTGDVFWYYIDLSSKEITEGLGKIDEAIRCTIETPRYTLLLMEAKC